MLAFFFLTQKKTIPKLLGLATQRGKHHVPEFVRSIQMTGQAASAYCHRYDTEFDGRTNGQGMNERTAAPHLSHVVACMDS
jgi:hypothetical protein